MTRHKTFFPFKITAIGTFALIISVSAIAIGLFKREVVLELSGGIFLICLSYCFFVILITGFLYRKKAETIQARIVPEKVESGGEALILLNESVVFLQMPFCIIRYKIDFSTKDKKRITHIFEKDFLKKANSNFTTPYRGAYYAPFDYVIIEDIFGFFVFNMHIPQSSTERLLVMPDTEKTREITALASGAEKRSEQRIVKTEDLTDQRIYVPGDDTRRINWKLYSHSGELFVRKEDTERPPHSRLVVLINTEFEAGKKQYVYDKEQRRAALLLDALCAAALSFAADCSASGIQAVFGWNGSGLYSSADANAGTDIPSILALPACIPISAGLALPAAPNEKNILIMALPLPGTAGAIEKFLAARQQGQEIEILFCYNDVKTECAATASALKYFRTEGVRAKTVKMYDKD